MKPRPNLFHQAICRCLLWTATVACLLLHAAVAMAGELGYYSPETLVASPDGHFLYVAERGTKQVAVIDMAKGKITKTYSLPQEPSGMALASAGDTLFTTMGDAKGQVVLLDLNSGKITEAIAAGHTPMSPVLSPDGKTLYICNRFNNDVMAIDLSSKKVTARIPVTREPVAMGLAQDGKTVFVANHLPAGAANGKRITSVVDVIDTVSGKVSVTF